MLLCGTLCVQIGCRFCRTEGGAFSLYTVSQSHQSEGFAKVVFRNDYSTWSGYDQSPMGSGQSQMIHQGANGRGFGRDWAYRGEGRGRRL